MTRTSGYKIISTKCCGAVYTTVRYSSINFSASEFWTDGARTSSLMPTDGGLRKCKCGSYFLLRQTLDVGFERERTIPPAQVVQDDSLAEILLSPLDPEVEVVVRRRFWRYLNESYRDLYRSHRAQEERRIKLGNRFFARTLRLLGLVKMSTSSDKFSVPAYSPDREQTANLQKLLEILDDSATDAALEKAEIFRELSRFAEAEDALNLVTDDESTQFHLVRKLITERNNAPHRYRM